MTTGTGTVFLWEGYCFVFVKLKNFNKHIKHKKKNYLLLNVEKTKELIVDFRKGHPCHSPLLIEDKAVEVVESIKFLGIHITNKLTWGENTTALVKRAQQRLFFLRRMRRSYLPPPILTTFYRSTIESVMTSCISVWCGSCTAADWKSLQRVVRTAEKIIGTSLPSIQDIGHKRCLSRAMSIIQDSSHPQNGLFSLLNSGRRYCSVKSRTARFCNSFFPTAIRLLNSD